MKVNILLPIGLMLLLGCQAQKESSLDVKAYQQEVDAWHRNRVENDLKGPTGWLNLAGLFWLNEGFNTFGSGEENDLVFPEGKIAANAGTFSLQQGLVTLTAQKDSEIMHEDSIVTSMVVHYPDSSFYPMMIHGSLQWFVIERNGAVGVRLRDLESEAVANFEGVDRYPIDPHWRVEADFEWAEGNRTIDVTNILGQTYAQASPGTLVFAIDGKTYRLDVLDEGGEEYFVIFGDKTNELETYPSGRYMYISKPDNNGMVIVDFNKSYNPPCAFSSFATCPVPPKQNVLGLSIRAGEKNFSDH
ncbi:MAG: DUF1684 domain-containing protein [Cyclobacteriaceae bacterium]